MTVNRDSFVAAAARQVLVVDDELVNREMLGMILGETYDVLFANDGVQALDMVRQHKDTLSLVLLDILMPGMSGLEVLETLKADAELSRIPVIVVTAEQAAEVESLQLGAIDFIPKPYPAIDVVRARVQRTIELSEDRDIINLTERDALTGLYNREFFYRYAEQFDARHPEAPMDAIVLDINHFHMINERYGRAYGDDILRRVGQNLRKAAEENGGIACRSGADTFMVYTKHSDGHEKTFETVSTDLVDDDPSGNRVRMRMGLYSNVDKGIDVERRFDRAKMAADTVKDNFSKSIASYDDALHEQQLYSEQLIEDFPSALAQHQFQVYFQPKFDVRPDTPVLSSAEALVRWVHPELGMINPGVFIPLFEENGLIQQLDAYVWRETAAKIADWNERFEFSVPVSVNVSRVDMYDPLIVDILKEVVEENGLIPRDLILEVTESAYTENSEQIIATVERLREIGFRIEMDDFGTGYSSLNMISKLPIDALKLDMRFIRDAFREGGNTHMLKIVIDLADYLHVPVVAEGVETEGQMDALRSLGCDIVQGYFFSKPVPAVEFEPFILQRKESEKYGGWGALQDSEVQVKAAQLEQVREEAAATSMQKAEPAAAVSEGAAAATVDKTGMHLRTATIFITLLAVIAAIALLVSDISVTRGYQQMEEASDRYIEAQLAASDMVSASDYLTDRVRCFVVTGEVEYMNDFFEEVDVTKRRNQAIENLERLLEGNDSSGALANLTTALELSNELINTENLAMRLMLESGNYDLSDMPDQLAAVELSPEDAALTPQQKQQKAELLVFDNNYMHYKDRIRENVSLCTQSLIRTSSQELERASTQLSLLVNIQTLLTVVFLLIVAGIVLIVSLLVRRPLVKMVEKMEAREPVPVSGVEELRFVTRTYNKILEENKAINEKLSHEASHDALTGLFNRGAYDMLMESIDTEHMALILIDVDYFKQINDTYGHAVGDRVLKRVADILKHSFRSVDIICRFGGDEFVVVMTRVNSSMRQLVINKIAQANDLLKCPKDDLPPVSLSVGVAFSDRDNPQGDIFKDADTALYRVKEAGRDGCEIY